MRKKLLICINEVSLAEKALAKMTQMAFYKSGRKDFTADELSEFTNNYMQLGLLEYSLHKLRLELTDWLKTKNTIEGEKTEQDP
ncbi:hypothetical protein [Sporomusa malonica]|uniref:Uncharacterized protein n=1 Tax=Sporomusa malonica TaxID=112901 RepID=A0A1W2DLJ2_9FIRM|nr:hypothetical protein [Sporomusa malonica]SMC98247.1 hypothetical protein SAMN04488500_116120 [Sporomusa malonica]